ncbi:MAG: transporter substrate-binding domain-containing protein, partial [Chloroflexota bacterium]
MNQRSHGMARLAVIATVAALAFGACSTGPSAAPDLLAKVKAAGKIVMSTDPEYPPQSAVTPSGAYEGFDIDVGTEIAKRLGVTISFETPAWEALTAGSWSGRWDFSVG